MAAVNNCKYMKEILVIIYVTAVTYNNRNTGNNRCDSSKLQEKYTGNNILGSC